MRDNVKENEMSNLSNILEIATDIVKIGLAATVLVVVYRFNKKNK